MKSDGSPAELSKMLEDICANDSEKAEDDSADSSTETVTETADAAEDIKETLITEAAEEAVGDTVSEAVTVTEKAESEKKENTPVNEAAADVSVGLRSAAARPVSLDDAKRISAEFIQNDRAYCMLTYLKAVSEINSKIQPLYSCAAYAYNDPMYNVRYSSTAIISLLNNDFLLQDEFTKCLIFSAALRNFFSSHTIDDYNINQLSMIISISDLPIPELKTLVNEFISYKENNRCGVETVCDYSVREHIKFMEKLKKVSKDAYNLYINFVETPYKSDTRMKRYKETVDKIFARDNFIAECLKYARDDDVSGLDIAKEFIATFIKSGAVSKDNISTDKITEYINEAWYECCQNAVRFHSEDLKSGLRGQLNSRVTRSLMTIAEWVELHESNAADVKQLSEDKRKKYIALIDSASAQCRTKLGKYPDSKAGILCVIHTLEEIRDMLDGSYPSSIRDKFYYIGFLRSDYVTLTENERGVYVPDLRCSFDSESGFDICSRILAHSRNEGSYPLPSDLMKPGKCNLSTLQCLISYGTEMEYEKSVNSKFSDILSYSRDDYDKLQALLESCEKENAARQFTANIERENKKFIEQLELAQSYGKFDMYEDSYIKENIQKCADDLLEITKETGNYGFCMFAAGKIMEQINAQARERIPEFKTKLNALRSSSDYEEKRELLDKYAKKIEGFIDICNFTAAEALINRISRDDIDESTDTYLEDANILNDFHNQYSTIYDCTFDASSALCNAGKIRPRIENYIINKSSARKDEKGGVTLIERWIRGNSKNPEAVKRLLSQLGLEAEVAPAKVSYASRNYLSYYDCRLINGDEIRTTYQHIVAPFGSRAYTNSFRVVCFFGQFEKGRLLAEINEMENFQKNTIIFVDYAYSEKDRREIAKEIKKKSSNEIYMVVDRVIITYLAATYQRSTITSRLMKLAMPFSYYQPYVPDSGNPMPPEMFIGRQTELKDIKSDTGANLIYGGRQLGKSALLKKAKSDVDGSDGAIAVYADIKGKSVSDAAVMVSDELISKKLLSEKYSSWESLTDAIKVNMKAKRVSRLLLLLDEGDHFIDECGKDNYQAIDALKRLSSEGEVRFKFVIAGLHNLARYDRGSSKHNSGIPHLNSLTIRPFKFSEAKELLEYPLSTLGIFFKDDEKTDGLVSTILAATNYFPGLIHLYCQKVVNSLCDDNCPCYTDDAPPYYVTEAQIQKILADKKFIEEIDKKFYITLRLEADDYYEIISLAMAWLCFDRQGAQGYTAEELYSVGSDFNISKITDLSDERLTMFMDELVDLNIFRKDTADRYVFSRRNFLRLMGTPDEVFDKLEKYPS